LADRGGNTKAAPPSIKGKSNLPCQPHFCTLFVEIFLTAEAGENFHEKECGGNSNSIQTMITGANCDRRDAWIHTEHIQRAMFHAPQSLILSGYHPHPAGSLSRKIK
jgi:hypothetical protein